MTRNARSLTARQNAALDTFDPSVASWVPLYSGKSDVAWGGRDIDGAAVPGSGTFTTQAVFKALVAKGALVKVEDARGDVYRVCA